MVFLVDFPVRSVPILVLLSVSPIIVVVEVDDPVVEEGTEFVPHHVQVLEPRHFVESVPTKGIPIPGKAVSISQHVGFKGRSHGNVIKVSLGNRLAQAPIEKFGRFVAHVLFFSWKYD
mmetsp:Transcript_47913/g.54287  ORF Transcript_47913/g.54287 Transcript_47913/m.54287 type:complete len:118 (-) Transcript_47913:153-506(-)